MPWRPFAQSLLRGYRDREQAEAMEVVARARMVRDEAFARSRLTPVAPLEGKATPIDPPSFNANAPAARERSGAETRR